MRRCAKFVYSYRIYSLTNSYLFCKTSFLKAYALLLRLQPVRVQLQESRNYSRFLATSEFVGGKEESGNQNRSEFLLHNKDMVLVIMDIIEIYKQSVRNIFRTCFSNQLNFQHIKSSALPSRVFLSCQALNYPSPTEKFGLIYVLLTQLFIPKNHCPLLITFSHTHIPSFHFGFIFSEISSLAPTCKENSIKPKPRTEISANYKRRRPLDTLTYVKRYSGRGVSVWNIVQKEIYGRLGCCVDVVVVALLIVMAKILHLCIVNVLCFLPSGDDKLPGR